MRTIITTLIALLTLTTSAMAEPPVRDDEPGWWSGILIIGSKEAMAPKGVMLWFWLPNKDDDRPAYIRNGDEFLEVDAQWDGERFVMDFPHFDSRIEASVTRRIQGKKIIEGNWTKRRSEGPAVMYFEASEEDQYWVMHSSNSEHPTDWKLEREGPRYERWEINFNESGPAIALLETTGRVETNPNVFAPTSHELRGTILTPTGDYRFLAGTLATPKFANNYILSVFDGAHAFAFHAHENPKEPGQITGDFYSGHHWHETFTARRLKDGETYELPDPFSEVSLKPGVTRLGIPKLNEAPYAGKPTIVQIFGTWCPNCHDEAPVLVDLYERYHAEGLQILSLAYEYTPDLERSTKQINRFKERHGASWEFVAAGVNDKQKTAATLPALSAIKSYPTTIWINPDGTVRAIHSGFSGPATGEAHTKTLAEFEKLTREIIGAQR